MNILDEIFEEATDVLVDDKTSHGEFSHLVVYNDDVNTFDWVIQSLIEICGHDEIQAEQCSLIVHFQGKATVKTDTFNVLKPMKEVLVERGISAVIETVKQES